MKDTFWDKIRYKYWALVPHHLRPSQIYYFLKCYFWKRYNVVYISTLSPTWNDRVDVLSHCIFQVLTDFVEKEGALEDLVERKNQHPLDPFTKAGDEIEFLYKWWKEKYLVAYPAVIQALHDKCKEIGYPEDKFTPTDNSEKFYSWDVTFRDEEHELQYNKARQTIRDTEQKIEKQLNEMLIRVLGIRDYLWT